MGDRTEDRLVADLRALGRGAAPATDPEGLARRVVAGLPGQVPSPRPSLRRLALAAVAILLVLAATPPVRATVADWFGFGGVRVERGDPGTGRNALPPAVGGDSLAGAADQVAFPLVLPDVLGRPDAVEVSADRRVVSMTWDGAAGPLRVDQFEGTPDYAVAKRASRMRFVTVAGVDAIWFPEPHDLVLLGPGGARRTESARLAGRTLVWPAGTTTVRLEGDVTLADAVRIAESAVPVR
jgi:hypothetical protein